MGFRYTLRFADGDDAGEAEYSFQPDVGDLVYVNGNKQMRVTAFVTVELVGEFVDRPLFGVLEVEPIGG
jgi:hypothetical protein